MLDNIWGVPITWYYFIAIGIVALVMLFVGKLVKNCVIEDGRKKCRTSLKSAGFIGILAIIYLVCLVILSVYVIVYGYTNGWGEVYTLDLTFAVAYLVLVAYVML